MHCFGGTIYVCCKDVRLLVLFSVPLTRSGVLVCTLMSAILPADPKPSASFNQSNCALNLFARHWINFAAWRAPSYILVAIMFLYNSLLSRKLNAIRLISREKRKVQPLLTHAKDSESACINLFVILKSSCFIKYFLKVLNSFLYTERTISLKYLQI